MTLNYSHQTVFPRNLVEDNLMSSARIVDGYYVESFLDKNEYPWQLAQGEAEEPDFDSGWDRADLYGLCKSNSEDVVDLLPSDPFGMDIQTTFTAITGWLEDLEVAYGGYSKANNSRANQEWLGLFSGWDLIWNNSLLLQPFPNATQLAEKSDYLELKSSAYDIPDLGNGSSSYNSELVSREKVDGVTDSEGLPHEALAFVLRFLGVKDLLSVEMVCKSLLSTVRNDPLLWMTININQPLNERITDDILVQLASKAQGNLQCLSLVECPKITDDGLRRTLQTNSKLTTLRVPGCTKITIECIVNRIKTYNSNKDVGGIKCLGIAGLFGVEHNHFEELKLLLPATVGSDPPKPHFFCRGNAYPPCDDRAIDIESCPKCGKFRLVYDCTAAGCNTQTCRACYLCIPRCVQCGRCDKDTEFEETFCLEFFCSDCFEQFLYYYEKMG